MGTWTLRWSFNSSSYQPKDIAYVNFWLDNTGDSFLHLSNLQMEFDFGTYDLQTVAGEIAPMRTQFLGTASLQLPAGAVGRKIFNLRYRIYEYVGSNWLDIGLYRLDQPFSINVYPKPLYRVFVSRGLRVEDRVIGDPIVEMIREWGFQTVTVGVEIQVPEERVAGIVREQIRTADAVIAIATPRHLDALTGFWKTLEWAHGEIGIGFGIDKPLLLLNDTRVVLGGLPAYLTAGQTPNLEFDAYQIENLRSQLPAVMSEFRGWIETKRRQEFLASLGKLAVGALAVVGGAVVVSGVFGTQSGSSKM